MTPLSLDVKDDDHKITARIFTSHHILTAPNLQLSRSGYFLIAVLSGGDYNQVRHIVLFSKGY